MDTPDDIARERYDLAHPQCDYHTDGNHHPYRVVAIDGDASLIVRCKCSWIGEIDVNTLLDIIDDTVEWPRREEYE